jgi:hypothetical protein
MASEAADLNASRATQRLARGPAGGGSARRIGKGDTRLKSISGIERHC